MLKRVKKLYKKNRNKNIDGGIEGSQDVDSNDVTIKTTNILKSAKSSQNVTILGENNNNSNINNNNTTTPKKKKQKTQKKSSKILNEDRKFLSQSTGNLLKNAKHQKHGGLSSSGNDASRAHPRTRSSHSTSVASLRESRLSIISQLDGYMDHVKRSVDDCSIANAPNRLCCAQLLKTVLQRREEQCMYESLHSHRSRNHGLGSHTSSSCSIGTPRNTRKASSGSVHNIDTIRSAPILCPAGLRWKRGSLSGQGTDSEISSINEEFRGCDSAHSQKLIDSSFDEDDDVNNNKNNGFYSHRMNSHDRFRRSNNLYADEDSDNDMSDADDLNQNDTLQRFSRHRSIPIFPQQEFDIY